MREIIEQAPAQTPSHPSRPATPSTIASEAEKIREAIEWARNYWRGEIGNTLADAAEKHLATLPQTKTVRSWRVNWTYKGCPGGWREHREPSTAREHAESLLNLRGYSEVTITWPHLSEVPA